MSVEIKTPTKSQYEHGPWRERKESVGRRTISASRTHTGATSGGQRTQGSSNSHHHRAHSTGSNQQHGRGRGDRQHSQAAPGRIGRKRRYSERAPGDGHGNPFKRRFGRYGRNERIVLPTKFLLGGNINDPLNLNSLCDEEISKALNEKTPVSSPLPIPAHKGEVKVLIPPNIRDPLGLDSEFDPNLISPKLPEGKKRKHKRKNLANLAISPIVHIEDNSPAAKGSVTAPANVGKKDFSRPMHINIDPNINTATASKQGASNYRDSSSEAVSAAIQKKIQDKIVSPVIPQTSPKKRKRRSSECHSENGNVARTLIKDGEPKTIKSDKTSPHRPKYRKQPSNQSNSGSGKHHRRGSGNSQKQQKQNEKFIYGNYNRYYGYRNPNQDDDRLKVFKEEWFKNLDVLDIGCNVGHVTLHIAQKFKPRSIVGTDIDPNLIAAARRNIRHYISMDSEESQKFPESMKRCFGPIIAPKIPQTSNNVFPNNVSFVTGDFVPEKDELVDLQKEEYDVILVLSVTKWIHLNHGDAGLKRAFKRMIRALRPGGRLILEPQGWPSYKRKKKLTEKIAENYRKIRLRPDQFTEYLLSREVGFSKCESLALPFNKAKVLSTAVQVTGGPHETEWLAPVTRGFQRPIQIFTKPETAQVTPQWSWHNTPNRGLTGSGPNTPWWEAMEAAQAAGMIVNPPIATMSPLVESPINTMSPLVEMAEPTPSPLVEDNGSKMVAADSVDTVTTSGIDSPVVPFEESLTGGVDSQPNTPKVKFMIGSSSGFCTPCDSAGQSPNPMYTQFIQQMSQPQESSADTDALIALQRTPSQDDGSVSTMLRVQSAPGLLETAPFRLKPKQVLHVGTAPGLLETRFCSDSCDSDCGCSSSSPDSSYNKQPTEGAESNKSPKDKVTSSQQEEETDSNVKEKVEIEDTTQNEAADTPPGSSTSTVSASARDLISESEVSSSSDVHSHQEQ